MLFIEISIGAILAGIIYVYSRKNEHKIEEIIKNMSKIMEEQKKMTEQQRNNVFNELKSIFVNVNKTLSKIAKFDNETHIDSTQKYKKKIKKINNLCQRTKILRSQLFTFLDKTNVEKLNTILAMWKKTNNFHKDGNVDTAYLKNIQKMNRVYINDLFKQHKPIIELDKSMPIVGFDKGVYLIGRDMLITVIDPFANKDSEVSKSIGDQEDSKLVIESPYGKIDGYKLKETGKSTGIFQGIIGILGVGKNGSIIPQKINGTIIEKIQGSGDEDGYIAGAPGDKLIVRYSSNKGTVEEICFIEKIEPTIELDKQSYDPSDKVHITIFVPDLSVDSEKINEIGQSPENSVTVRTSNDKIENYKLLATGDDTEIFTGEIQLGTKKMEARANGIGFVDGRLFCTNDDFIEVSLRTFYDEIIEKAQITRSKETDM